MDDEQVSKFDYGSFDVHWIDSDDLDAILMSLGQENETTACEVPVTQVKEEPVDDTPTEGDGRFPKISEETLDDIEAQRHSASTIKNTKWALKMFSDWSFQTRKIQTDWVNISPEELATSLRSFYAETRPRTKSQSDDVYHKNTMRNIRSALNRHLRVIGRDIDIVKDKAFHKANDLLNGQLKQNVRAGLSKPTKHKPIIEKGDIVKIREYLNHDTPTCVLQKVWFDVAIHYVTRGLEFHSQLSRSSFTFKVDDEGREFATLTHDVAGKTNQGGIDDGESHAADKRMYATGTHNCPVKSLKLLIEKSHPGAVSLFCIPKSNAVIGDNVWFSSKPLSQRQYGNIIRTISKEAGLSRIYTPHSVRATAIQALSDASVELRHIMFMSGHRNEASVRSYNRSCTSDQQHKVSSVLRNIGFEEAANRQPSATVSRPPSEGDDAQYSAQRLPLFQNLSSQVASSSGNFMSRSSFHNCQFNFNFAGKQ